MHAMMSVSCVKSCHKSVVPYFFLSAACLSPRAPRPPPDKSVGSWKNVIFKPELTVIYNYHFSISHLQPSAQYKELPNYYVIQSEKLKS